MSGFLVKLLPLWAFAAAKRLEQFSDPVAREMVEQFIRGERER